MLIHLHTIDGRPVISIDPEGDQLPVIETLPGLSSTYRVSWPSYDRPRGLESPRQPASTAPSSPQQAEAAIRRPDGHRIGRYAAMTGAFGVMLIVGMVIGTLRGNDGLASTLAIQAAPPQPSSFQSPPIPMGVAPLRVRSGPSDTRPIPYEMAPPVRTLSSSEAPSSPPLPPSTRAAPAFAAPAAPKPANPGILFGLHS